MWVCAKCSGTTADDHDKCSQCGAWRDAGAKVVSNPSSPSTNRPAPFDLAYPTRVVVSDIHMSFSSMVGFMVKWAIASIPAFLILAVVTAVVLGILSAVCAVPLHRLLQ